MTREEALALSEVRRPLYCRYATGTDGERWFWTTRADTGAEWTWELLQHFVDPTRLAREDCAELDPPGVDWAPGHLFPDPSPLRRGPDPALQTAAVREWEARHDAWMSERAQRLREEDAARSDPEAYERMRQLDEEKAAQRRAERKRERELRKMIEKTSPTPRPPKSEFPTPKKPPPEC